MTARNEILERGLERWREHHSMAIDFEMRELTVEIHLAHEGLGISHRNPGEVREDIIEYLWGKLEESALKVEALEKEADDLMAMDLPTLTAAFMQGKRRAWAFLNC